MARTAKGSRDAARPKRREAGRAPAAATGADEALRGLVVRLTEGCEALAHAVREAPKAADLRPLVDHLSEFVQVAPRLLASLQELSAGLSAVRSRSSKGAPPGARPRLEQVSAELDSARRTIVAALDTLPRDPEYGAVARQLRELATVSPSLMEWLQQVPRISTPLAASAKGLRDVATSLGAAQDRLAEVVRELWPDV